MQNNFFGSKLNTALLLVLIILMIFALRFMYQNKEAYIDPFFNKIDESTTDYPINSMVGYHVCGSSPSANDCLSQESYDKVLGKKEGLIAFSLLPEEKVQGEVFIQGILSGKGWFFEGNIPITVVDQNQKHLGSAPGQADEDWWESTGPVGFSTTIDFTDMPKGPAYIKILPDEAPDSAKILIPIVIESDSDYTGWKTLDEDEIHFLYPPDWTIEHAYVESEGTYYSTISSPDGQGIGYGVKPESTQLFDVRQVESSHYYMYINKNAPKKAKIIFNKVVASAEYRSAE